MSNKLICIENRAGKPIALGDIRIIPIARSVRIQPPGYWGCLRWNRPAAVIVQTPDWQEHVIPIRDVTRQAQFVLLGVGILGSLLIWLFNRKRDE